MQKELLMRLSQCRVCKDTNLKKVVSFGSTPLANAFLSRKQIDEPEYFYPLDVVFCKKCTFLQLSHVVSPQVLFGEYVYVSSTSSVFVKHFKDMADDVFPRFNLNSKSLVIDIGSNDGILLKPFKEKGARVLGIEPAVHIAKLAQKDGIQTMTDWFSVKLAKQIVKKEGKSKIIAATNVFAHIHDLDEVIHGLRVLLDEDGVFIIEAPYLIDFIQKRYFDLVYHEHLSYWAIGPLITLFKRFDMEVFDVQKVSSHGGTIRVFVQKKPGYHAQTKRVKEFLNLEKKMKLNEEKTYLDYANIVLENRMKLITLLTKLKNQGKKIVGFGAPAKGNTLLNYFKIGQDILDYIVDDSVFKQGLFTPGTHVEVVSAKKLQTDRPDYILILAWNFAEPIMQRFVSMREKGIKFIIPVPKPSIK